MSFRVSTILRLWKDTNGPYGSYNTPEEKAALKVFQHFRDIAISKPLFVDYEPVFNDAIAYAESTEN